MSFLSALPAIVGAAGSLIKGKTPKAVQMAEAQMARQQALFDEYLKMVRAYDPAAENASAFDYAQKAGSKTIESALKSIGANAKRAGGADTNILFNLQRAQDSVLNPMSAMIAERKANEYLQKLNAFQSAIASAPSGQLQDRYLQLADRQQQDIGPALSLFSSGVDQLLNRGGGASRSYAQQQQPEAASFTPQLKLQGIGYDALSRSRRAMKGLDAIRGGVVRG